VSAASDESRGASGPDTPSPDGDEAALVVVPDFTTLRVPQARRAARAVGLRLIVRDDFGDPIEASFSPGYRVRSQQVPAGRAVPRGTEVRALAEAPAPIVSGY
jgi:beta-lactam-binding protein with PASTA domain